jgi:hypothetical protein
LTEPARAKHLPLLVEEPHKIAAAYVRSAASRDREHARSRRKHAVRGKTISIKRGRPMRDLEIGPILYPLDEHDDVQRPATRGDCEGNARPCPFVSCKHHLYLDVSPKTGAIHLNFPDLDPDELAETCALDVADRGGVTLEEVGDLMNLTRERIRQLEKSGRSKGRRGLARWNEDVDEPHDAEAAPPRVDDAALEAFDVSVMLALAEAAERDAGDAVNDVADR